MSNSRNSRQAVNEDLILGKETGITNLLGLVLKYSLADYF